MLSCPNNPEHKRFSCKAKVIQEWYVNELGDFISEMNACTDVLDQYDYTCVECGAGLKED
jgi:hypothetical protein